MVEVVIRTGQSTFGKQSNHSTPPLRLSVSPLKMDEEGKNAQGLSLKQTAQQEKMGGKEWH